MTSVTEVRSASTRLFAGTWRPLKSVITTLYYVAIIFQRSVWYRALSLRYSKFGHHPHPLGYVCAKFCFFRGLQCWASPWRKIAYSITHSPRLFNDPGTEALALRKNNFISHNGTELVTISIGLGLTSQWRIYTWGRHSRYAWWVKTVLYYGDAVTVVTVKHALQNTQNDYHQWLSQSFRVHQIRF